MSSSAFSISGDGKSEGQQQPPLPSLELCEIAATIKTCDCLEELRKIVAARATELKLQREVRFLTGDEFSTSCYTRRPNDPAILNMPISFIETFERGRALTYFQKYAIDHMLFHIREGDSGFTSKTSSFTYSAVGSAICGLSVGSMNIVGLIVGVALVIFGFYSLVRDVYRDREKKETDADAFAFRGLNSTEKTSLLASLQKHTNRMNSASTVSQCVSWFWSHVYVATECFLSISEKRIEKMRSLLLPS